MSLPVLVFTKFGQSRTNDFFSLKGRDGELVFPPWQKIKPGDYADDDYGTFRSFWGLGDPFQPITTTARIAFVDVTRTQLAVMVSNALHTPLERGELRNAKKRAAEVVTEMLSIAGYYRPGAIIELREGRHQERKGGRR